MSGYYFSRYFRKLTTKAKKRRPIHYSSNNGLGKNRKRLRFLDGG